MNPALCFFVLPVLMALLGAYPRGARWLPSRLVIAAGTDAISDGLHAGGYAEANGIANLLPVSCLIPGDPPHPWSLIHGLLLAMGRDKA